MKRYFSVFLALLILACFSGFVYAAGDLPDIFVCQSYGQGEDAAGLIIESGMIDKLKELGYVVGEDIKFYHFFMDTQTKYRGTENIKMRAGLALEEIKKIDKEVGIDLLLIFDDNAFEYVALPLAKTKYKILFNGMNVDPEYYDKDVDFMDTREHPGYNISGIKEQSVTRTGARLMKMIYPQAKNMAVLANVSYPHLIQMANEVEKDIIEHPENYPLEIEGFYRTKSWEEYQQLTLELNSRDDVDVIFHYAPHGQYDKKGNGISYKEFTKWIVSNQTNKPEFVAWAVWVKFGFLCGAGTDLYKIGEKTGLQVHKVLQGEDVGNIPIEFPRDFYIALNLARAQQLGIEIPFEVLGGAKEIHLEMFAYPEYKYKPQ
ncbi:MAG: ABC transporter substrate binding protein [Candidatus Omnitrophota bacterium]